MSQFCFLITLVYSIGQVCFSCVAKMASFVANQNNNTQNNIAWGGRFRPPQLMAIKRARPIIRLVLVIFFILSSSGCTVVENLFGKDEPIGLEFGYSPPIVPLRVSVNTWGEVNISATTYVVTPLGTFDANAIADPTRYFDGVQNTLTIRIDDQDCIFDLNGGDFDFELQGNNYELVRLNSQNKNIFVELKGQAYTGCKQRTPVASRRVPIQSGDELNCPGASPSHVVLGGRAVISVNQATVHTEPSELAPLVRNKYLRRDRLVTIVDGPVCGQGNPGHVLFWKVQSEEISFSDGSRGVVVGWVGEESGDVYLLKPY